MKKLPLLLGLSLLSNFLFASDITEVVPLSNRVLLVHFDDGYAIHHKLGQLRTNESIVDNPLNVVNASAVTNYFLSSTNDVFYTTARRPDSIGRKTKPTEFAYTNYFPTGKDYVLEHWVYLFLPKALESGKFYKLTTGSLAANGNTFTFTFDEKVLRSEAIHVNNIGYTQLASRKYGYVYQWLGDKGSMGLRAFQNKPFNLVSTSNNQVVFTGTVRFQTDSANFESFQCDNGPNCSYLGATVFDCDFSSFNTTGEYKLVVPGIGCSFPFEIKRDVYRQVYKKAAKGLYQHRSGIALKVPYVNTPRPAPHNPLLTPGFKNKLKYTRWRVFDGSSADANRNDLTAVSNLAKGPLNNVWGWYQDAGDWDSYYSHAKVPMMMLNTFEVAPNNFAISELNMEESTNQLPDFLDEARWQIRFYHRLRKELISTGYGTGGVGGGRVLGDFTGDDAPGDRSAGSWQDTARVWYVSGEDPWQSYKYAGLAAQFAFILKKYCLQDPEGINWEQEAIAAYQWAKTNTKPGDEASKFDEDYFLRNDRSYAAAALYRLTKQAQYNTQAIADLAFLPAEGEALHYPNSNKQFGIFMYTMAGLEPGVSVDAATFTKCKNSITSTNDFFLVYYNERGTRWRGNLYDPMVNGNQTTPKLFESMMGVGLGKKLGIPDATLKEFKDKLYLTADYFLGTNALNTTWISGLGERSPNQDIFQLDGWYNGTSTITDGIIPYGAQRAYGSTFPDINALSPDYPISGSNGTKIYPADFNKWPGHERWFNQRWAPNTCEYTIHQTIAPALCVYAFLSDSIRDAASCNTSTGTGTGLSGNYYNNITLTGVPVYSKIEAVNFDWGYGSPNAVVKKDNFSARWEGFVQAPVTGTYTFSTISDDGVRLFINDIKIIDNFTDHPPTTNNGNQAFTFTAGAKYKIKMEYYERGGGAVAKLLWTIPGQAPVAIPLERLYPAVVTSANKMQQSQNIYTKEIQISPNPAHENTKLSFYSEKLQAISVNITDLSGRVVKRSRHNASEGFNTILLPLPQQPGMYIIQVIKNGNTEIKKVAVN
jgi:endoglucanase